MTLMDTYLEMVGLDRADEAVVQQEEVKVAEEQEHVAETVKVATDYDAAGRRLAHVLFGNFVKSAAGFPGKEETETEREEEEAGRENKPSGKAPSEKEDKEKDKEKRRKKEGDGEEQEEKKASVMERLRSDPEYREAAVKWYTGQ